MIDFFLEFDRDLFLELNSYHAPWLDILMMFITKTYVWIPLYAVIAFFIFKLHGKQGFLVLICIALTILLADQITSTLMKPYFARLRPAHDPELAGLVHIVDDYRGGKFGFASSHAANTFGLAVFVFLLFRQRTRTVRWIFVWALLVSYSRIYLGVHYPGDIIAGGVVGAICAVGCFVLYQKISFVINKPEL
ncbi:MAG TPA: phosphatase PAP2 family protein [Chryseosolibacter sp.]